MLVSFLKCNHKQSLDDQPKNKGNPYQRLLSIIIAVYFHTWMGCTETISRRVLKRFSLRFFFFIRYILQFRWSTRHLKWKEWNYESFLIQKVLSWSWRVYHQTISCLEAFIKCYSHIESCFLRKWFKGYFGLGWLNEEKRFDWYMNLTAV